ncbi:Non-reducing end alpha-L-arabinofuranosidase [Heracleum sosnowskyi]|uniref:non-reducing end alpha-L-arabinofuranosidase n=1 Tax=Heracleum sosnowskyi TaxID=360622 RepID=A0AAD8HGG5_9APIA|nr:Non-reducing end alpha-L-arabinofuranosidase [Heracleum sosnowskyi]
MGSSRGPCSVLLCILVGFCAFYPSSATDFTAQLFVNATKDSTTTIPDTLFGIFFEEINHAGAGGLWAELVDNRGFEAGGQATPSDIAPWFILGDETLLVLSTDRSSCFEHNKVALRMEVFCDSKGPIICPAEGVGVYNPGFWGMNIEQGMNYKLILYLRSYNPINVSASLTDSTGSQTLATVKIIASSVSNWTRMEFLFAAEATNPNSRLQLTTTQSGVIWFDQVSLMPVDTYKGRGFRNDLFKMLADIKPAFLRFPGGCFIEGNRLPNAVRWKDTIGPWEERPGHYGDVWDYWTDDGLGHLEFLQLAEDLGALPIWVFNNAISLHGEVNTSIILPFIHEILDGLEFAKGDASSTWGSVRASLGHPEPFDLRYVAIGNEECQMKSYRGNYLRFYDAIKHFYPDIQIISNCDGSSQKLDHPADMYDYHIYTDANTMFSKYHAFDYSARDGPKAFVSEYAVTKKEDAGTGSLLAALAEAGFLLGLERNSDIVEMASYAPLFVNTHDRRWNPDAIVFNSAQVYGTPSYWMQQFFVESNGASLLNSTLQASSTTSVLASAIIWKNTDDAEYYLRLKFVNFGSGTVSLKITINGVKINTKSSTVTTLTSNNVLDENSFDKPAKVAPVKAPLTADVDADGKGMVVTLSQHSLTSIDVLTYPDSLYAGTS